MVILNFLSKPGMHTKEEALGFTEYIQKQHYTTLLYPAHSCISYHLHTQPTLIPQKQPNKMLVKASVACKLDGVYLQQLQ
jgi:hypothetical protein